jgi:hypothetical protein
MNIVDPMVLAAVASADVALFAYLRRRYVRCERARRMSRSLSLAIRRELTMPAPVNARLCLRRAS